MPRCDGDVRALAKIFTKYRNRLKQMIKTFAQSIKLPDKQDALQTLAQLVKSFEFQSSTPKEVAQLLDETRVAFANQVQQLVFETLDPGFQRLTDDEIDVLKLRFQF